MPVALEGKMSSEYYDNIDTRFCNLVTEHANHSIVFIKLINTTMAS